MSQTLIARTAASYGGFVSEAQRHLRAGRIQDARWYAKNARSDWRWLCQAMGKNPPAAHRTADSFFTD
jgi:hypothetical protein